MNFCTWSSCVPALAMHFCRRRLPRQTGSRTVMARAPRILLGWHRRGCERMHCRGGLCRGVGGLGSSSHLRGATFSCATCMNLHGRIVKPQSRRSLKRLQLPLRPTCSYSAVKSRIPEPELKPSRLSTATTMASCRRRPPAMLQCLAYLWVFGHWWPNSRFKCPKSRTGVIDRTLPRSPCSLSPVGKSFGENEKLKAVGAVNHVDPNL